MFLSQQQLVDLTHKVRPSAQAKWLDARGWKFERRYDGTLVVHELEAQRRLCSGGSSAPRRTEPDLKALQ